MFELFDGDEFFEFEYDAEEIGVFIVGVCVGSVDVLFNFVGEVVGPWILIVDDVFELFIGDGFFVLEYDEDVCDGCVGVFVICVGDSGIDILFFFCLSYVSFVVFCVFFFWFSIFFAIFSSVIFCFSSCFVLNFSFAFFSFPLYLP